MRSTECLIGHEDLYDATAVLRRYAPKTPGGTLAATYERAVFDLLYHHISQGKPVPGYQAKDIDDAVDFEKVNPELKLLISLLSNALRCLIG